MLKRFLNFFSDPQDGTPAFITLTRNILIFTMVTTASIFVLVSGILPGTIPDQTAMLALGLTTLLEVASFIFVLRGQVGLAKFMVPLALLITVTYLAINGSGLHDVAVLAFPVVIVVATLLLGSKSRFVTTPLAILAIEVVVMADLLGINTSIFAERTGIDDAFIVGFILLATSGILQLLVSRLNENVVRAQDNEQAQILANQELRELQVTLENRVASRTSELEQANQRNERRAKQFEAIAQVARAATLNQDLETLLPNLAELISHQFGFYHVGVFLLDEERNFAELRAANSEGGRRMLTRGHKLAVGQSGIVGYVSATGKARIALDVGDDAAFFNNPDLPETRSEMALPLRLGDDVIGVLDVQSLAANAFGDEDIEVLSTLADQVAIAIQNARSYEYTQNLLRQAQLTSGSLVTESWKILQDQTTNVIGYHVMDNRMKPLDERLESEPVKQALANKTTIKTNGQQATLAVPIRLREEVIGILDIKVPEEHDWEADEVDVAEAVAERLSLALESALLLKATQRRAEIERITADISTKIGATTQFESILRTAAEELSRVLGGSEVLVQLREDALQAETKSTARTARA